LTIDLSKSVFQVHGVDERGNAILRKQLRRNQVAAYFARQERCLIGMEACAGAHHWARELTAHGHEVRLIAPQFVKPYVKANKTDAADAEAICEAVTRPNMRFVPVKSIEQQSVLSIHRARAGFVKALKLSTNAFWVGLPG
jgi:transposase